MKINITAMVFLIASLGVSSVVAQEGSEGGTLISKNGDIAKAMVNMMNSKLDKKTGKWIDSYKKSIVYFDCKRGMIKDTSFSNSYLDLNQFRQSAILSSLYDTYCGK